MKRLLLLAVVSVVAAFGFSGVASAASCGTPVFGQTYWDGNLEFNTTISGCSNVDAVQLDEWNSGWVDWTISPVGYFIPSYPYLPATHTEYGTSSYYFVPAGRHASWCSGAVHSVSPEIYYRIHNTANGGSWGSWHWGAVLAPYLINC